MKKRQKIYFRGFSLIEVALAIGIMSFVLVSLLGLFMVGLDSSRKSGNGTALARIISQVVGEFRGKNVNPISSAYYFDVNGVAIDQRDSKASIFYSCQVSQRELTGLPDIDRSHLVVLVMAIDWPGNTLTNYATLIK